MSKSMTGKNHPYYYLCRNRSCEYKNKSIRRDVFEDELEELLRKLTPSKPLITTVDNLFKALWDHQTYSQQARKKQLEQECLKLDKTIEQLLDRIVEIQSSTVLLSFEKRIDALQKDRIVIEEKITNCDHPVKPYGEMYRTALEFLANPLKAWTCGGFVEKRTVLKLSLTDRIIYDRKTRYRTPDLSLLFKALERNYAQKQSGAQGRNRTGTSLRTRDFKSLASTDFATWAGVDSLKWMPICKQT